MRYRVDLDFSIHQDHPVDFEVKQESNVSDIDVVVQQGTGLQNVVHSDDFSGNGTESSPLSLSNDFKEVVENKVDKTTEANQIYGTDSQGNQTTYPAEPFNTIDDVLVNGVSVVENKIAEITVPTKVSELENDENFLREFTFEQGISSTVWVINHNLGHRPSGLRVLDSAGTSVGFASEDIDENTCELYFNSAFKGTAYLC